VTGVIAAWPLLGRIRGLRAMAAATASPPQRPPNATILDALGDTQSAGLSEAPEPGTLVLFGTGILLMAVSRIRRSHLVPATRAGALAIGHRSRI